MIIREKISIAIERSENVHIGVRKKTKPLIISKYLLVKMISKK